MELSNLIEDGVPAGGEDDYVVLHEVGRRPEIDQPRDHLELGEGLRAIDVVRGAKVSGSRFYYLTGVGAQLELGILNLAMAKATAAGSRGHHADPGPAGDHGRHRLPGRPFGGGVPARRRTTSIWSVPARSHWPDTTRMRSSI